MLIYFLFNSMKCQSTITLQLCHIDKWKHLSYLCDWWCSIKLLSFIFRSTIYNDEACKSINRITLVGIEYAFLWQLSICFSTKSSLMMMILSVLLQFVILNVRWTLFWPKKRNMFKISCMDRWSYWMLPLNFVTGLICWKTTWF